MATSPIKADGFQNEISLRGKKSEIKMYTPTLDWLHPPLFGITTEQFSKKQ